MKALAEAPLSDVLRAWQGLGYNRRAIALQTIAKRVINEFGGRLPNNPEMLETFPGIGPNTAGSICAFAFNAPTVFIETNIRAVFLHHFFPEQEKIHDRGLLPLVDITLERERPREWYYALMDYGVHLKKLHRNPSRRSAHYTKQSTFEGSHRQLRARLLRQITERGHLSLADLVDLNKEREEAEIARALSALEREHFIAGANDHFTIS
jgi:A/G-specific adenine glycosylase